MGEHWGPEGPPPHAYGRVSNPERFAPLHDFARELLVSLQSAFDVEWVEGSDLESGFDPGKLVAPSVRLLPRDPGAAPLLLSLSDFPGVHLRAGLWFADSYPACGCDACAETLEGEIARLRSTVECVTAGRLREAVELPLVGNARQNLELWSAEGSISRRRRLSRAEARQLLKEAGRFAVEWRPWPPRQG